MNERYNTFSKYLKNKYGEKVYKIPVNIKTTCPNRDGTISSDGCIFCGDIAAGFELLDSETSLEDQIKSNIDYIGKKYNAKKYIIYLQNYTQTYLPLETFKENTYRIVKCNKDIVAIYISTRPDCISNDYIIFLSQIKEKYNLDIVIELGLQTTNDNTLKIINRGHKVNSFIDAVERIHSYDLEVCAHIIIDLPYDDDNEVENMAELMNRLSIEQVKCHSLYILKNTILGEAYLKGDIIPIEYDKFLDRSLRFIRHLDKDITIQRLIGRAPKEDSLFCNWGKSWWKIRDEIISIMDENNYSQGDFKSFDN